MEFTKEQECMKAIQCLFLATNSTIAGHVKEAVLNALNERFEKDTVLHFGRWLLSLTPAQRCTVHPPVGSGSGFGLYEQSVEDLLDGFMKKERKNINNSQF